MSRHDIARAMHESAGIVAHKCVAARENGFMSNGMTKFLQLAKLLAALIDNRLKGALEARSCIAQSLKFTRLLLTRE